ncbi:MAG: hypothetical protein R2729_25865 [Bryobacteraceae bacterium]
MKRIAVISLILICVVLCLAPPVAAQSATISHVLVKGPHPLVPFTVDGKPYLGAASFLWPEGSKHILHVPVIDDGCVYNSPRTTRACTITGWGSAQGNVLPNPATITANKDITEWSATATVEHKLTLVFYEGPLEYAPGYVSINSIQYFQSFKERWFVEGTLALHAQPYPGSVFIAWQPSPSSAFLRDFNFVSPTTIVARFSPAKRVNFQTDPVGLRVRVDRNEVRTEARGVCVTDNLLIPGAPTGIKPLCTGEFDFLPGSQHLIGAPSPQVDRFGKTWIFKGFDNGLGDNSILQVPAEVQPELNILARFVPGVSTSFATEPQGLKLRVNERDNWPQLNFVFAPGSKQVISAPAEQTDARGRKYVFKRWLHGGEATQELIIPEEIPETGLKYVAEYEILSQLVIHSDPAGGTVMVDGAGCKTPCKVDRHDKSEVVVEAPEMTQISEFHRMYFTGWSDDGDRAHSLVVTGVDPINVTMRMRAAYKLNIDSDPADAADYFVEPASPDGYYPADGLITVTATAKRGYRFRRWGGDLEGTSRTSTLMMARPRTILARFDKVSEIDPAGVRNAAGQGPDNVVAPGSLISIFGANLAPYFEAGPTGPILKQAIAGISVTVSNRILPLLFVSPDQINAQLPRDLAIGEHEMRIIRVGAETITGRFQVSPAAPGLFHKNVDEQAVLMAYHEDGSEVSAQSPARKGETITFLGTGFGAYESAHPEGFALPAGPGFGLLNDVAIQAGDTALLPEWAGGAPGQVGIDVVKVKIPEEIAVGEAGSLSVKVNVGGIESNATVLPIDVAPAESQ